MIFSFYGTFLGSHLHLVKECLEKDGHIVILNQITPDVDVCLVERPFSMYFLYPNLKIIKKNKIKLVNFVFDIPIWRFLHGYPQNTIYKTFRQILFNNFHKNSYISNKIINFKPNQKKKFLHNYTARRVQYFFNTFYGNRFFYQKNYRTYLKQSDLILSISNYTRECVKRFLKLDTKLCYPSVNSDYLLSLSKADIKYDAINISRIVRLKRQEIFVKAAKKLDLNIMILGNYYDKSIVLDCPHYYYSDVKDVYNILNQSRFYVDPSIFEGFGMTPVEAAFLNKISIVSDTYVHKDVLGDYPLYFERDNVNDLVDKMKIVIEGAFKLNNLEIKKKYSIQAFKERLMAHIESLF